MRSLHPRQSPYNTTVFSPVCHAVYFYLVRNLYHFHSYQTAEAALGLCFWEPTRTCKWDLVCSRLHASQQLNLNLLLSRPLYVMLVSYSPRLRLTSSLSGFDSHQRQLHVLFIISSIHVFQVIVASICQRSDLFSLPFHRNHDALFLLASVSLPEVSMSVRFISIRRLSAKSIYLLTAVSPKRIRWWLSGFIVRSACSCRSD